MIGTIQMIVNSFELSKFNLSYDYVSCEPIEVGHINKTFRLKYSNSEYILQVINSKIFKSIPEVMRNISVVTEHLKSKEVPTLEYLTTCDGYNYDITSKGEYVRICKYIDAISMEFSNDLNYIYNAGLGFGEFCYSLIDVPTENIAEVISNFHDTNYYINRLFNLTDIILNKSKISKCENLLNDIYHLKDYSNVTNGIHKRVTHNDIKFSNILFDKFNKSAKCVIDLDTIMLGYLPYDFADGVRSICHNLDNTINLEKFDAYSKGFFRYPISIEERSTLIDSIVAISIELSSRYLFEYLNSSNYFNLRCIEDNLTKASGYILFAKDIISKRKYIKI